MAEPRLLRNFVNGEYVESEDGPTLDLVDPTSGDVFA
jgi:betaine-aldehyde dehydrogenase